MIQSNTVDNPETPTSQDVLKLVWSLNEPRNESENNPWEFENAEDVYAD